jgi:hypothetical protein
MNNATAAAATDVYFVRIGHAGGVIADSAGLQEALMSDLERLIQNG